MIALPEALASQMSVNCGENLVMRLAVPSDAAELVDFNTRVFDERITDWTADLVSGNHPTVRMADFTVVEDTRLKKIVSSVCLISQTWDYSGIPIQVGRSELVATDPEYRRRGLVRKQFDSIHARSAEKGELMQVITGVDWFYRQFGYDMGVKLWGSRCVDVRALTALKKDEIEPYRLRALKAGDQAWIHGIYDKTCNGLLYSAKRSQKEWDYEFTGRCKANTRRREWWILEDKDGEAVGYLQYLPCLPLKNFPLLRISQVELKPGVGYLQVMPSLLRGLWEKGKEMVASGELACGELEGLEFALERDHPLFQAMPKGLARELKASPYYIRIPDMIQLLRRIRPALEKHLRGSLADGYSGELKLSFYRGGIRMNFERGRILAIDPWSPAEIWEGDAKLPDSSFLRLVCGWQRFHELADSFADCWGTHEAAVLLDCLFPAFHGKPWVLA
jgi:hypothetical protein